MTARAAQTELAFMELRPLRTADISPCKLYRYTLVHIWDTGPIAVFGLCNPSTAEALKDDHTSRKCDGFTRAWGFAGRIIVNPCALRSRDSKVLLRADDPVGPDNDYFLRGVFSRPDVGRVVLGWGDALPISLRGHGVALAELARELGHEPMCLGRTRSGQPMHPLMLSYSTALEPWRKR